jgi:hypothetical protein
VGNEGTKLGNCPMCKDGTVRSVRFVLYTSCCARTRGEKVPIISICFAYFTFSKQTFKN